MISQLRPIPKAILLAVLVGGVLYGGVKAYEKFAPASLKAKFEQAETSQSASETVADQERVDEPAVEQAKQEPVQAPTPAEEKPATVTSGGAGLDALLKKGQK